MYNEPTTAVHEWIATQISSGVRRDDILKILSNSGWDPALIALHEWTAQQARSGRSRDDVRAAIGVTRWPVETVNWLLAHYFPDVNPRSMTIIEMHSFADGSRVSVEVDQDHHSARAGGYGLVCKVEGLDGFLAKRLDMRPPLPPGQARKFLTHVKLARARLGTAKQNATSQMVQHFLDEILDNSLSTHYSYEQDASEDVCAVWFLLPRASGKDLCQHFRDDRRNPPDELERVRYAEAFAQRMRTLRRPGLVHMDCTTDNIRVDRVEKRLVMIDLDGCGIERQTPGGPQARKRGDAWDVEPMTLGKQGTVIRVPPWYPQEGIRCGPNAGNFKFGERWVALDTIIQILSWGRLEILGWLDPQMRADLSIRYSQVSEGLTPALATAGEHDLVSAWTATYSSHLSDCARRYLPLKRFTVDDARARGCPPCLAYFANLAQNAYLDPRVLSGQPDENGAPRSLYADFSQVLSGGIP